MKSLFVLVCLLTSLSALAETLNVAISGMTCGMCVSAITSELQKTNKVEKIDVSLEKNAATFTTKKNQTISDDEVKKAIKKAGYTAVKITRS